MPADQKPTRSPIRVRPYKNTHHLLGNELTCLPNQERSLLAVECLSTLMGPPPRPRFLLPLGNAYSYLHTHTPWSFQTTHSSHSIYEFTQHEEVYHTFPL